MMRNILAFLKLINEESKWKFQISLLDFSQNVMHLKFQSIHHFFYWLFFFHSLSFFFYLSALKMDSKYSLWYLYPPEKGIFIFISFYLYAYLITKKEGKNKRERERKKRKDEYIRLPVYACDYQLQLCIYENNFIFSFNLKSCFIKKNKEWSFIYALNMFGTF